MQQYEWDVENRLVAVTRGTHRSEFEYDPLGRRSRILEKDQDANGAWTDSADKRYLWEGAEIAVEETADGTTLKQFFGQGFVDTDGTNLYYTRDHLGSVRELVDAQQVVRARYDYDPYGRMTKLSGDRDSEFLYAGYLWHGPSGLYLTLFRAYDPETGRWISRDPIKEQGGVNLYAYVENNPISGVDPLGLKIIIATPNYAKEINEALDMLRKNPWMKNIIDRLEKSNKNVYIYASTCFSPDEIDSQHFTDPNSWWRGDSYIHWDPYQALEEVDSAGNLTGHGLSPATLLGHELDHSDQSTWEHFRVLVQNEDHYGDFQNREEWRVITGSEHSMAQQFGEWIRWDHTSGSYEPVSDPTQSH